MSKKTSALGATSFVVSTGTHKVLDLTRNWVHEIVEARSAKGDFARSEPAFFSLHAPARVSRFCCQPANPLGNVSAQILVLLSFARLFPLSRKLSVVL